MNSLHPSLKIKTDYDDYRNSMLEITNYYNSSANNVELSLKKLKLTNPCDLDVVKLFPNCKVSSNGILNKGYLQGLTKLHDNLH